MKKILVLLLSFMLVFATVGCGNSKGGDSTKNDGSNTVSNTQASDSGNASKSVSKQSNAGSSLNDESVSSKESTKSQSIEKSKTSSSVTQSQTQTSQNKTSSSNSKSASQSASKSSSTSAKVTTYADAEKHGLPIMFLNTKDEVEIVEKEYVSNNEITIFDKDGKTVMAKQKKIKIKCRGNTTATFDKKPFALKFDSEVQPFSLGEKACTRWNLLANRCDRSFIRNNLGLTFCEQMGIDYVPDYQEVELYYNGNYRGVYLLCEAVNEEEGRVDISTDAEDGTLDSDYLVVLSKNSLETNVFKDSEGVKYEIKNDLGKASQQLNFVKAKFDAALAAVKSGNQTEIAKLIDIDSAVNAYVIEEALNNMDVGWDSFYFTVKKGQTLKFGPLWDFDVSMGNGDDNSQYSTGFSACKKSNLSVEESRSNLWFYYLTQQRWFREKVVARWNNQTVKTAIDNLKANVTTYSTRYESAFKLDFAKWNDVSTGKLEKINFENENILSAITYDAQVTLLKTWINERVDWLNAQFASAQYLNGVMPNHFDALVG